MENSSSDRRNSRENRVSFPNFQATGVQHISGIDKGAGLFFRRHTPGPCGMPRRPHLCLARFNLLLNRPPKFGRLRDHREWFRRAAGAPNNDRPVTKHPPKKRFRTTMLSTRESSIRSSCAIKVLI